MAINTIDNLQFLSFILYKKVITVYLILYKPKL